MLTTERARRVLLVDDHPGLLTTSADLLRDEGFAVEWCSGGESALVKLDSGEFGVVVLDLRMPGMDGLELLSRCRGIRFRFAFIIHTAVADFDDAAKALNLGAAALVEKHHGPEALINAVHRVSAELVHSTNQHPIADRGAGSVADGTPSAALETLEALGDGVLRADAEGHITYLNPMAEGLLGVPHGELLGAPVAEVYRLVDSGGESLNPAVLECLAYGKRVRSEGFPTLCRKDGASLAVEETAAPLRDAHGELTGVVLAFRDVSRVRASVARATHDAAHDPLTGLVNRREFEVRLKRAVQCAESGEAHSALMFLDLDRFKQVNDSCGHSAGDQLLRQISQVLQRSVRNRDTLARLGGDEFGILLEGCSEVQAERLAENILRAVADYRFLWEGRQYALGASMGLVALHGDEGDIEPLLQRADQACYAAKEAGRNQVVSATKLEMAGKLPKARGDSLMRESLARQRLSLAVQRIHGLQPGAAPMCELFARLYSSDGALIPPGAFIPVAERYQLMPRIDRQMVTLLCRWLSEAREHDSMPGCTAVNLSAQTLHDAGFADYVVEEFRRHDLPLSSACFEVRECDALANLSATHRMMTQLQCCGAHWALDDFGSGLGAIRLLKHLPVDFLKFDDSLVREICSNSVDLALLRSLIGVALELGLRTVAKRIEGTDVLARLRELGVDYAQGDCLQETELLAMESL